MSAAPLVETRGLQKHFPIRQGLLGRTVGQVHAVEEVDLAVAPGEVLGLVGESAPASPPSAGCCCACSIPRAARSALPARTSRGCRAASCGRSGAGCR